MIIDTDKIKRLLEEESGYKIAKKTGLSARTINKYQAGDTPFLSMTLKTAGKIMLYIQEIENNA